MSQENVERLRAGIESFLAGTSESARKEMLSNAAAGWDSENRAIHPASLAVEDFAAIFDRSDGSPDTRHRTFPPRVARLFRLP